MRAHLRSVVFGFLGMVLALLAYQAYLDHRRVMQHEAAIAQIVVWLNQRAQASK